LQSLDLQNVISKTILGKRANFTIFWGKKKIPNHQIFMTSSNYIAKNTEKVFFQENLISGSTFKNFLNDGHFG
jgi:hypothetical protein